jgi:hypothetical protein
MEKSFGAGVARGLRDLDAIFAEAQVPEEWQRYIELNAAYYRNRAA